MAEPAASVSNAGCRGPLTDQASLRRALREAIEESLPEIRVVAEGFLAEVSPIDLLAVGGDGALISIRIAAPGGDAATLTRALADLSWLRPRRADFLQLAPALGIEPSAEPRALLVACEFGRETRAAADNLSPETVQLWRLWSDTAMGRPELRIESVASAPAPAPTGTAPDARPGVVPPSPSSPRLPTSSAFDRASPVPIPAEPAGPGPATPRARRTAPLSAPPSPSAFRTNLVETDLDVPQQADGGVRSGRRSHSTSASGL